jgi:hypothetical protein
MHIYCQSFDMFNIVMWFIAFLRCQLQDAFQRANNMASLDVV